MATKAARDTLCKPVPGGVADGLTTGARKVAKILNQDHKNYVVHVKYHKMEKVIGKVTISTGMGDDVHTK